MCIHSLVCIHSFIQWIHSIVCIHSFIQWMQKITNWFVFIYFGKYVQKPQLEKIQVRICENPSNQTMPSFICRIFWIGLDRSTLLIFWEIAAKLCFCTNATSSNYFRTHQFCGQGVVLENLSPFFLFVVVAKNFFSFKK